MRGRILRSTLLIPMVLLLAVLGPGPAFSSTLTASNANAYGLKIDLLGSELIPPTPSQSAGPGITEGAENLVEVDLDTTAFVGAVGAKAINRAESVLTPELPDAYLTVRQGGPAKPALYNAQAYARTAGALALASDDPVQDLALAAVRSLLGENALLAVDGVSAEALVSCVNGQVVTVGGSLLTGVELAGLDLTDSLDGSVNQVVDLAGGLLEGIATLIANEQIVTPNGLEVNALRLTIDGIINVVIGHAAVSGAVCAPLPQCSDGIDNDGDGHIDFPDDPNCTSRDDNSEFPQCSDGIDNDGDGLIDRDDPGCYDRFGNYDPNHDNEASILPRTGGDGVALGASILAAGGLMLLLGRKVRRSTLEG